jgi:acetyl esterase
MQSPLPARLKRLLFFINLVKFDPAVPMNKTRSTTNRFMKFMNWYGGNSHPSFYSEKDHTILSPEGHNIRLKIYTPYQSNEKLPVWLYIHGGGFCHGEYDSRSNFCKTIATRAKCIVVSVDYRLAPEYPFPAAPNDVYTALQWLGRHAATIGGDGNRLAVGGESAGGNLSAVVALMARDKGGPAIKHQTLLYPAVDMRLDVYPSMDTMGKGYMLEKDMIRGFHNSYAPDPSQWGNPYLSPVGAVLNSLPPALVITAGYDPLVDEGDLYAEKLKQAGVPVLHKRYDNMIHDFTMLLTGKLPEARDSVDLIVNELQKTFY